MMWMVALPFLQRSQRIRWWSLGGFWDFGFFGGEERRVDFKAGGGGEDSGVGVGVEGEEPSAAAELGEGNVHGIKGAGIEGGTKTLNEFAGAFCGGFPGDRVTKPGAGFEFLAEDFPGFVAWVPSATNESAADFEFGEAADYEGERGFTDIAFGRFGLPRDMEMERSDEVGVEVVHRRS